MPSPQVAAVAVMALLAAGVILGSVTSPLAESASTAPILLEIAEAEGSPPPPEPAPAAAPAPAPAPVPRRRPGAGRAARRNRRRRKPNRPRRSNCRRNSKKKPCPKSNTSS